MKNIAKFIGILFAVIHCMTVNFAAEPVHKHTVEHETNDLTYFASGSIDFLSFGLQPENPFNAGSPSPSHRCNDSQVEYYYKANIIAKTLDMVFANYSDYYACLLIKTRKSDLFYPFHYFW